MKPKNNRHFPRNWYIHAWGLWVAGLIVLSWLDRISVTIPHVGDLSLIIIAVSVGTYFMLLLTQRLKIKKNVLGIVTFLLVLILIYLIGDLYAPYKSLKSPVQIFLIALYFFGAIHIFRHNFVILLLANIWIGLALLHLGLWITKQFAYPFQGIFTHKNTLGSLISLGLYFILAARMINRKFRWWWNIGLLASLIVLFASGSRASWLLFAVAAMTYVLWPMISARIWIAMSIFLLFISGIIGFVFYYLELYQYNQFEELARLVAQYTSQNLYSGRQNIWASLIDHIHQHPWGLGPGATPERLLGIEFSAHNIYLQITLQVGFIGLITFIFLLTAIWIVLITNKDDKIIRLTAGFFLGILVHQTFEVSLTQNNMIVGLVMWTVIAAGVGRASFPIPVLQRWSNGFTLQKSKTARERI